MNTLNYTGPHTEPQLVASLKTVSEKEHSFEELNQSTAPSAPPTAAVVSNDTNSPADEGETRGEVQLSSTLI